MGVARSALPFGESGEPDDWDLRGGRLPAHASSERSPPADDCFTGVQSGPNTDMSSAMTMASSRPLRAG